MDAELRANLARTTFYGGTAGLSYGLIKRLGTPPPNVPMKMALINAGKFYGRFAGVGIGAGVLYETSLHTLNESRGESFLNPSFAAGIAGAGIAAVVNPFRIPHIFGAVFLVKLFFDSTFDKEMTNSYFGLREANKQE
eukprot:TRINITY_DN253_c0_g1_i1.p1 TRINITY_DN253_c0_g1~~TRINITY_DN253_c0_g1_i1.p1  ORF type:complete len:158 (-),score=74.88 TRINITY_DN253_c0_g1_i1:20-433(-)